MDVLRWTSEGPIDRSIQGPTDCSEAATKQWTKMGEVFPGKQGRKMAALRAPYRPIQPPAPRQSHTGHTPSPSYPSHYVTLRSVSRLV
ncbi:unnamed protein product [Arctogadus glacialis]